jgi:hypothetical protein
MDATAHHKRFIKLWLVVLLSALAGAALTNYLIDPYGLFNSQRIDGWNAIKPVAASHVRTAKPYQVSQFKPHTVIAGNSRPEIGLDPLSACWPAESKPVFNSGLPGADLFTQARSIQHAIAGNTPTLILWGLDFGDFLTPQNSRNLWDSPDRKTAFEQRLLVNSDGSENHQYHWIKLEEQFRSLLSLNTLFDSLNTLQSQDNGNASSIRKDGFNPAQDYMEIITWEGQSVLFRQKNDEVKRKLQRPNLKIADDSNQWSVQFESVDRLLRFAREHKVKVVLFINPYHADYLVTINDTGHWENFEQWKRTLTQIAEQQNVALWDFSTLDSYASETPPAPGDKRSILRWFWEPAHYRKELGDLMLKQMLNTSCNAQAAAPVGILLSPANLEQHLLNSRQELERHIEKKTGSESIFR